MLRGIICHEVSSYCPRTSTECIIVTPQSAYMSRVLCIIVLPSQGSDLSVILRGLMNGQKKEIYFWNKTRISCNIIVASKRSLISKERAWERDWKNGCLVSNNYSTTFQSRKNVERQRSYSQLTLFPSVSIQTNKTWPVLVYGNLCIINKL